MIERGVHAGPPARLTRPPRAEMKKGVPAWNTLS
jgi:hypothetical protein